MQPSDFDRYHPPKCSSIRRLRTLTQNDKVVLGQQFVNDPGMTARTPVSSLGLGRDFTPGTWFGIGTIPRKIFTS